MKPIREVVEKAVEAEGAVQVRNLKQKEASTVGWYYEFGSKGGFQAAALVFRDVIALVDRLLHEG
jgi:hypothetical protein